VRRKKDSTEMQDVADQEPVTAAPEEGERADDPRRSEAARLLQAGSHDEAAERYEALLERSPEDLELILGLASALIPLGRFETAEKELKRAQRIAPRRPEVYYLMGLTYQRRGNYNATVESMRRVVELDDAHGSAYQVLGEALNQLARPNEALEALERAVALSPENGRAYYGMGIAYDRLAKPERAAEMYRKAREVGDEEGEG
jgi:tetratricopeptide (TPR) repeat protein